MNVIRESPTALYRQIAEVLRERIRSGGFEPVGKLPSEAELVRAFGVSRVTVRLALQELADDGLIDRRRGKGTFVTGREILPPAQALRSFHESLCMRGMAAHMRILSFSMVALPEAFGASFGEQADGACVLLRRLHLVQDEPIALGRSYLPRTLAHVSEADAMRRPTYALLGEIAGHRIATTELSVGAIAADEELGAALGVERRAPLLMMERTSTFEDGSCAERSTFYVRPERYRFVLRSDRGA